MSNATTEYWDINGTSLNQYAWNITSFGVGRNLPVMRGSNIQVGYVPGQIWRKKYPDSRVITLAMWTAGISPVTDQVVTGTNTHQQMSSNVRLLQDLFYNVGGEQFSLTRRWKYTLPPNVPVPTLITATAMAEVAGNMQIQTQGANADSATFSIDLLLADPYFYGPSTTTVIPYNTPTTILNTGDDVAAYVSNTITFFGPLQYPNLTNSTTTPDTWLQLNTVILAGDSILFDASEFTAYRASDGANLSGLVTHSGTKRWMSYNPGNNNLLLTSYNNLDTGNASVSFIAPYV
jgi:hypothetical protein